MIELIDELLKGGYADPPHRRRIVYNGVTVALARINEDLVATIKGSFSPIFMWGRTEFPFTELVDEVAGRKLYAAPPWPDLRPEPWLANDANRDRLMALRLSSREYLLHDSNMIDMRGRPRDRNLWRGRVETLVELSILTTVPRRPEPGLQELVAMGIDSAFVERWAVGDDVDREAEISKATDADLVEMLSSMAAYWPRLAPVAEGQQQASPVGDLVGLLTDAAQEVEIELDRRRGIS